MSRAVFALVAAAVLAATAVSAGPMPCTSLPMFGPAQPAYSCLNAIPFNTTVALNVLATQIVALEGAYAFRDIATNYVDPAGVYPSISIDLVAELKTIQANVLAYAQNPQTAAPYASDYAFQFAVQDAFSKLYDAHTSYALPMPYSNYVFYQLMRFEAVVLASGTTRTIKAYPIGGANIALYSLYSSVFGSVPFQVPGYSTNGPVIDGMELKSIDGVDAVTWFATEADRVARISRDPGTRYNLAVHGRGTDPLSFSSWAGRSLSTVMPTHTNHTYTLMDGQGNTHTVTLQWLCNNRGSSLSALSAADAYTAADPDDDPVSAPKPGAAPRPARVELPFETEHRRMARGVKRMIAHHKQVTGASASNAAAADLDATTPPQLTYSDIGNGIGVIKILSFPDMTSSDGVSLLNNLQLGIAQWTAAGNKYLYLDLNGNGGGDICGGYAIIRYLFPQLYEREVPLVGQYDWPATPLFQLLANASVNALATQPGTGGQQLYPYVPWYWKDPVRARFEHFGRHRMNRTNPDIPYPVRVDRTVWETNAWVTDSVSRVRVPNGPAAQFTQLIGDTCDSTINLFAATPDMFPAGGRLDASNVVLLSNGFCGSTCSVFSSFIQMHNLAKTVVFGSSTAPQQFWSFPGGQVGDMTAIWPLTDYFGLSANPLVPPKPVPGAGSSRMTFREIYPWNWHPLSREDVITTAPLPLEWHFVPATYHPVYTPTVRPSDLYAQYDYVRTTYLPLCVDGVSTQPPCTVSHGAGVVACGGTADTCRVTRCDAGYYSDTAFTCSACPAGQYRSGLDALFEPLTQCMPCGNADAWAGPDTSYAGHSVYTATAWTNPNCPFDADGAKLSASLAITGVVTALVGGLLVGGGVVWYARRQRSSGSLGVYTDKQPMPSSVTGTPQL